MTKAKPDDHDSTRRGRRVARRHGRRDPRGTPQTSKRPEIYSWEVLDALIAVLRRPDVTAADVDDVIENVREILNHEDAVAPIGAIAAGRHHLDELPSLTQHVDDRESSDPSCKSALADFWALRRRSVVLAICGSTTWLDRVDPRTREAIVALRDQSNTGSLARDAHSPRVVAGAAFLFATVLERVRAELAARPKPSNNPRGRPPSGMSFVDRLIRDAAGLKEDISAEEMRVRHGLAERKDNDIWRSQFSQARQVVKRHPEKGPFPAWKDHRGDWRFGPKPAAKRNAR